MGMSGTAIFFKLKFPAALPSFFSAIKWRYRSAFLERQWANGSVRRADWDISVNV